MGQAVMPVRRLRDDWFPTGRSNQTGDVIHDVDSALRALIEGESGMRDVDVVFDAPTREWAARRTTPTVDVYLYDIREDLRRRERGVLNEYNEDLTRIVGRHLPPRHFKLSYLVTAWTQRPEDEHRLLSALLAAFLRHDALPADLLSGPLAELELPVPLTVGLPPPEDRGFADVWSALGGELKPSIDVVVSTPMTTGQQFPMGPPVRELPRFRFGGSEGFPPSEQVGSALTREESPTPSEATTKRAAKKAAKKASGKSAAEAGPKSEEKTEQKAEEEAEGKAGENVEGANEPGLMERAGVPAQTIGRSSPPSAGERVSIRRVRIERSS